MPKFKSKSHFNSTKLKSMVEIKSMLSNHKSKRSAYKGDDYFLNLADAYVVHSFYEHVECILEAINEFVLNSPTPSANNWHEKVITKASKFSIDSKKVFSVENYSDLLELRRLRNKYIRELPKVVLELDIASYFVRMESLLPKVERLVKNSDSVKFYVEGEKPKTTSPTRTNLVEPKPVISKIQIITEDFNIEDDKKE